jgi:hypothetical protein
MAVHPTKQERRNDAVGPKGSYPIWDKKSAKSAEILKGKHPALEAKIDRRAAKFGVGPDKKKQ